jgi:uncharacterized Zn finger protein
VDERRLIDDADIESLTSRKVFERGLDYFADGMVLRVVQRGNVLSAEVQGSEEEPYHVSVELTTSGIGKVVCTCPYDWDDACKHVVAMLLKYVHQPTTIEQRPPLAMLLSNLDVEQLRRLVQRLVEDAPQLVDVLEDELQRQTKVQSRRR